MANGENTVTLTIDGREGTVGKGTTIMEAAETLGIFIPHFCFHKDLSWSGTCRMCLVEVEKAPKLMTACCTTAGDGMAVHTNTEKVRQGRRAILEFLLLSHPVDCPICDQAGECSLQNYYMEYGLYDSRFGLADKRKKRKAFPLGDMIVLDRERCVLCRRCVRFCKEVSKSDALDVQKRGEKSEITTFNDAPIEDPYSGNLADICPVGALTSRKFRFRCRVWFLERVPSVCASCGAGCNIFIDQNKDKVYRFVARRNPLVNSSWICDEGRMSWERLQGEGRLLEPVLDGKRADWDAALEKIAAAVGDARGEPQSVAAIASPDATNEENHLLKKYACEMIGTPHLDFRVDPTWQKCDEIEDHLLRRVDKHPNTRGALDLGMTPGDGGRDVDGILQLAKEGKLKVLLVFNQDIVGKKGAAAAEAMKKAPLSVYFGEMNDETAAAAGVALPI
ncbi:MAG: 2Fe-2S iron-sulfur cluster-binding protein, partial [bacterium]